MISRAFFYAVLILSGARAHSQTCAELFSSNTIALFHNDLGITIGKSSPRDIQNSIDQKINDTLEIILPHLQDDGSDWVNTYIDQTVHNTLQNVADVLSDTNAITEIPVLGSLRTQTEKLSSRLEELTRNPQKQYFFGSNNKTTRAKIAAEIYLLKKQVETLYLETKKQKPNFNDRLRLLEWSKITVRAEASYLDGVFKAIQKFPNISMEQKKGMAETIVNLKLYVLAQMTFLDPSTTKLKQTDYEAILSAADMVLHLTLPGQMTLNAQAFEDAKTILNTSGDKTFLFDPTEISQATIDLFEKSDTPELFLDRLKTAIDQGMTFNISEAHYLLEKIPRSSYHGLSREDWPISFARRYIRRHHKNDSWKGPNFEYFDYNCAVGIILNIKNQYIDIPTARILYNLFQDIFAASPAYGEFNGRRATEEKSDLNRTVIAALDRQDPATIPRKAIKK